jgi:hypothetical protein
MDRLHLFHLIFLSLWGGVVAAEFVVELALRRGHAREAAVAHYWIDLLVEGPLLLAVLITGGLLLQRAWPPSTLHVVKIACALVALAINSWCVLMVIARRRSLGDDRAFAHYQRRVFFAGVGAPFALAAAWIGFAYFI